MLCCDRERHENSVATSTGEIPSAEVSCRNRIESFVAGGSNNRCASYGPVRINHELQSGGQIVAPKLRRCKAIRYRHEELLARAYTRPSLFRAGPKRDSNENDHSTQPYE
jgi:hypothetical protein